MMNTDKIKSTPPHVLPPLPYADNALDPVISANTIGFYYGKAGMVEKMKKRF